MKEQFCTYEIALALKELGFDEACLTRYSKDIGRNSYSLQTIIKTTYMNFDAADKTDTPEHYKGYKNSINQMFGDETIAAPLWQQAIDWFDKKGIIIEIVKYPALRNIGNHSFTFCVYQKAKESLFNPMYVTRYEAREAAILKAIELCQKEK